MDNIIWCWELILGCSWLLKFGEWRNVYIWGGTYSKREVYEAVESKEFKISKFSNKPISSIGSLYSLFNWEIFAIGLFGKKNI
jgi:hypothetical protein